MRNATLLASASLALLAGCSQGPIGNSTSPFDQGLRTSYRAKFVPACEAGVRSTTHSSKDFSVVCGCVADKLIATKNAVQLMTGPPKEEVKRLAAACVREHPIS